MRDAPVEPPVLKHGVALRVWLGHLADPAALREMVEAAPGVRERDARRGRAWRAVAGHRPGLDYPELVDRWGERYWAAERDLADDLLRDLEEMNGRRPTQS